MTNALRTAEDYELFLYSLPDLFPSIKQSTITFVRIGRSLARASGDLTFEHDIRVVIRERLVYHRLPAILWTGMAMNCGEETKNYIGMTPNLTRMISICKVRIPTINIFLRI